MSSLLKTTRLKQRSADASAKSTDRPRRRANGTASKTSSAKITGADADRFEVEFWGVRGSLPTPGRSTRRYGGNTPCIELRCGTQTLIFDLGTGARELGKRLQSSGRPVNASIFFTHYHYDHLQGLPFFTPFYDPRNHFRLFGAAREGRTSEDILRGQMVTPYFPISAESFGARMDYADLAEEQVVRVGHARVRSFELNHPGGCLAFRVDFKGRAFVFATDSEFGSDRDAPFLEFARGADVLVYDAMYTEEEYAGRVGPSRRGWGHSTWNDAIRVADAAGVRHLVLYHHDPAREDAQLQRIERTAQRVRPALSVAREAEILRL